MDMLQRIISVTGCSLRNGPAHRPGIAIAQFMLSKLSSLLTQVFRHCVTIPDTGLKDPAAHAHAG